ncbi:MAG: DUF835 domain-containing protein [Thermoplasmata archaeon]
MNGRNSEPRDRNGSERAPDEEFARAYALGYEEGIRTALKEMIEHAARGHSPAELRMLLESRVARLSEEVEVKRRTLLAPPRRTVWATATAPPRPWSGSPAGRTPRLLAPGRGYLVPEPRPDRALELIRGSAPGAPRILLISRRPPELPGVPDDRRVDLRPSGTDNPSAAGSLGELSGRIRDALSGSPGAWIYLDAVEFLLTSLSPELVLHFVRWLLDLVEEAKAGLIVSVDPSALEPRDFSRLSHLFDGPA